MADTNQGSHMATDEQAAGNTSSATRTQGAVPMRQTSISSHSMQTTRRAAKNVGKRSRRRRRSQHHVPVIAFVIVAMAVMGAFTYWMTHQVLDDDNGPSIARSRRFFWRPASSTTAPSSSRRSATWTPRRP